MKLGLINSAFAQAGKGTRFGLEKTKELGFDTVDIFTDPLDIDATERALIKNTCHEADCRNGVRLYTYWSARCRRFYRGCLCHGHDSCCRTIPPSHLRGRVSSHG
jgi:hypothetical protein